MNYHYIHDQSTDFTLDKLTKNLAEFISTNRTVPEKIYLKPEYFLKVISYTQQYVQSPQFLGIPLALDID